MKPVLKWILCSAVLVFAAMQFANPVRVNPPGPPGGDLSATNAPPLEIAVLLRNACYDCHSSETHWPWYSRVAPVSWWLSSHVNDARERLNFSDWPHDDPQRARKKWNRIGEQVSSGDMPLPSYAWVHARARLTAAQREQIAKWAEQEAQRLSALSTETNHD
jgi:hypothetical protein